MIFRYINDVSKNRRIPPNFINKSVFEHFVSLNTVYILTYFSQEELKNVIIDAMYLVMPNADITQNGRDVAIIVTSYYDYLRK